MRYNVDPDGTAKAESLIWENCRQCNKNTVHLAAKVQQYQSQCAFSPDLTSNDF